MATYTTDIPAPPDLSRLDNPFTEGDVDDLCKELRDWKEATPDELIMYWDYREEANYELQSGGFVAINLDGVESEEQIRQDPRIMLSCPRDNSILPRPLNRPMEDRKKPADNKDGWVWKKRNEYDPKDVVYLIFDWRPRKWELLYESAKLYDADGWVVVWLGWPRNATSPLIGVTDKEYRCRPLCNWQLSERAEIREELKQEAAERCEFPECRKFDSDSAPLAMTALSQSRTRFPMWPPRPWGSMKKT